MASWPSVQLFFFIFKVVAGEKWQNMAFLPISSIEFGIPGGIFPARVLFSWQWAFLSVSFQTLKPPLTCLLRFFVTFSQFFFSCTSQASRLAQDSKDKPTSLVVRESCPPPATDSQPQSLTSPSQTSSVKPVEQAKVDPVTPTPEPQGNRQPLAFEDTRIHSIQLHNLVRSEVSAFNLMRFSHLCKSKLSHQSDYLNLHFPHSSPFLFVISADALTEVFLFWIWILFHTCTPGFLCTVESGQKYPKHSSKSSPYVLDLSFFPGRQQNVFALSCQLPLWTELHHISPHW